MISDIIPHHARASPIYHPMHLPVPCSSKCTWSALCRLSASGPLAMSTAPRLPSHCPSTGCLPGFVYKN